MHTDEMQVGCGFDMTPARAMSHCQQQLQLLLTTTYIAPHHTSSTATRLQHKQLTTPTHRVPTRPMSHAIKQTSCQSNEPVPVKRTMIHQPTDASQTNTMLMHCTESCTHPLQGHCPGSSSSPIIFTVTFQRCHT